MILIPQAKIDEYTGRGWWGTTTLWNLFEQHVNQRPDAEAVVDAANRADFAHGEPRRLTWAQLADAVDRFCRLLLDAGVRRDERLLMQLPNGVEQYIVYLSCARLGIVITPVPVQYRENELDHILAHTQAAAVVTFTRIGRPDAGHAAAAMFGAMRERHAGLRVILAWGDGVGADCIDIGRHSAAAITDADRQRLRQAEADAAVTANDVFTICWTSGTEARPKGVPRSHNEWLVVAPSIIDAGQIGPHARLLNPFPLVNMAGISTAIAAWLVVGGTVVQHQPFSLPVFLQQIRDEHIDYTVAPPAVLNMLLQNTALLEGIDFRRLSRIGSGSAPLSEWMVRGFKERFDVEIINYFGSNEGAALAGNHIDLPDPGDRATFFPRAGVKGFEWSVSTTRKVRTRLVDLETGQDIDEAGHVGELRFTGPTIFSGYYNAPELSARAFDEQGYYRTGDLFEIAGDRKQFYRYAGRSKDLVIRGGMNISAEEVEGLLQACPGIREVAIVGVPDPILGEKVCACIVVQEGRTLALADIVAYLRQEKHVAAYKLPEHLLVLPAMPRNPVGKILKTELRVQARAVHGENAKAVA
ncbi:MAG: acyl--CoA ligase [Rhodoferax sp.]|nr:acyl--CoA ligase [Rhodoferax sp.]